MSTEAPDYEALVNRIGKVERENRRMKRAGLALVILSATLVLMGQSQATKVVEANEFVLKDASGHMRARLWFGLKPTKSPARTFLTFYDSTGESDLITLTANAQDRSADLTLGGLITTTPSLNLSTNAKGSYASFEAPGSNRLQGIELLAEAGKSTVLVSGTGDIFKGVSLTDSAEGGELYVNDAQGDAEVSIMAKQGKDFVSVQNGQGASALLNGDSLSLGDEKSPAVLSGGKDGPYLNLSDAQGFNVQLGVSKTVSKTTGRQQTSSAASLQMFNGKGEVIWSAP
jgi:hypothetical protein